MEFSETRQQFVTDVTSGLNDHFKAKLEKLMQDKSKNRDRLQPPVPAPRTKEIENFLEHLQLPILLPRSNEIENPPQNISHSLSVSRCAILRPAPPLILLPTPPPRTYEIDGPLVNLSVGCYRPLRLPPPPPLRPSETQNIIPDYNPNDNSLRSPILPPIPPPRTNDTRKPTQDASPLDSGDPPPVTIPPLLPPRSIQSQQKSRSKKLHRRISSESFRKRFHFLFPQKANEEGKDDSQESTASLSNSEAIDFPEAIDVNEGNKEVKKERFNEADVDAYLLLESAMAALDIGLPVDEVKRAIKEKLERTGSGFQSGDDLIESVLRLKEEGCHQETDHLQPRQVSEFEIQVCLRSAPALAALNMDLSLRRVKQAIKDKLELTGCGFSSEDSLIEAALNIPEEEELLADNTALTEKNKGHPDEERMCKICMDAEICIVFIQCGHMITCLDCSKSLKNCPLCRCPIESTVRAFLP